MTPLVYTPTRYLADPALTGAVLRLDTNAVLRDGDLLGRLLDTFVAYFAADRQWMLNLRVDRLDHLLESLPGGHRGDHRPGLEHAGDGTLCLPASTIPKATP